MQALSTVSTRTRGIFSSGASTEREQPISVVATLSGSPESLAAESLEGESLEGESLGAALRQLTPQVHCLEVRADLAGDIDSRALRAHFSGELLYTLRSTAAGGRCADPGEARRRRLLAAAEHYRLIDLEVDRDLHPEVLEKIEPGRRVLSWHGPPTDPAGLRQVYRRMTEVGARLYRLAPAADSLADALAPLLLLKSLGHRDVTAYARGPAGTWTRVLTARFGAPVMFGQLAGGGAKAAEHAWAEGELPLRRLLADYPHDLLTHARRLYGIVGASTIKSVAPSVNNHGFKELGLPAFYLPFSTDELPDSLAALRAGLDELGLPLGGACVVTPYKDEALALADEATELARRAGAANVLRRAGSGWWADNEAGGVVATLAGQQVEVAGRPIAVIGCGGAGRAAAAGLSRAGAEVTLVNRDAGRGERAARLLRLPFVPLARFDPRSYSVLVHATLLKDELPFPIDGVDPATVVFDLNYGDSELPLITAARAEGHRTIDGREMARVELCRQFQLLTGQGMPVDVAQAAVNGFRWNSLA